MITDKARLPSTKNQQEGATLIIVLMVVLLLSMVGAIAVRNSQVSFDMTTASQVKQLLMQSSDVPLAQLELSQIQEQTTNFSKLDAMTTSDGPFMILGIEGEQFANAEYVICFQPTDRKNIYGGAKIHMVLLEDDTKKNNENGFCKPSTDGSGSTNFTQYTSARKIALSQMSLTRPTINNSGDDDVRAPMPFAGIEGTDRSSVGQGELNSFYVRTYVTSLVPQLSETSLSDIDECLDNRITEETPTTVTNTDDKNQVDCLLDRSVPVNVQIQDFQFVEQPN